MHLCLVQVGFAAMLALRFKINDIFKPHANCSDVITVFILR